MKTDSLQTPSFLLDLDALEGNLKKVQSLCDENGKQLWPMTKTHKSTKIALLQKKFGAKGFLVGTLDEAEALIDAGLENITLAYPLTSKENISRAVSLSKKSKLYISIDSYESARLANEELESQNETLDFFMIIDSGLHRLGVSPEKSAELASSIAGFKNLNLVGISTHPGHVYGVKDKSEIADVSKEETDSLSRAKKILEENSFEIEFVATGSTPTFFDVLEDENINILRPGNYPFYDNIQISLGICQERDCSLSVLATIISKPSDGLFITDVGSKCLGLDKGAHASSLISGFGRVKNHPELEIVGLSEEVGKISIKGDCDLKIGDKIEIIPNHSCSAANMTSYLVGHRNHDVEEIIEIDIRGSSKRPKINL